MNEKPSPLLIFADNAQMAELVARDRSLQPYEWQFVSEERHIRGCSHGGKYLVVTAGGRSVRDQYRREEMVHYLRAKGWQSVE